MDSELSNDVRDMKIKKVALCALTTFCDYLEFRSIVKEKQTWVTLAETKILLCTITYKIIHLFPSCVFIYCIYLLVISF